MTSSEPTAAQTTASIDPATRLGLVRLTVADLDRQREFYERAIGLRTLAREGDELVRLGAGDGVPLVELVGRPAAPERPPRSTGLFHQAILVPSRTDLARALRRVVDAGWRFTGASDHLVSEALYLDDPEGNGIELYRDRPRSEWPQQNGQIQMATIPLDLDSLLAELEEGAADGGMPAGTTIGHVHLNVASIPDAEAFYSGVLGFGVTVRGYPGALFVSAGGYHHHLGLNTWRGGGAPPPPAGARGLERFEVVLPSGDALDRLRERVTAAGVEGEFAEDRRLLLRDPSGNALLLRAAA